MQSQFRVFEKLPSQEMGSRPKDHAVKEAFKACQDSFGVHPKLIKRLKAYYVANDPDRFGKYFNSF